MGVLNDYNTLSRPCVMSESQFASNPSQQLRRGPSTPWLALAAVSIALAGCGGGGGAAKEGDAKAETKIPVEVAIASRRTVLESFQGTTSLEAEAEAQVVTKTSGVVLKLYVEEGDSVRKGDVIAELDSERQRLALKQSVASLRKLENDYKRQQELFARKLIGQEAFERIKFDLDNQRASFEIAELELSYTKIRAPIAGTVSRRFVKIGNLIGLNQAVYKIDDFEPLQAILNVPEREMPRIRAGQPAQMLVDAVPGQVFVGSVARVAPTVDSASGTFRVVTEFTDPSSTLRSGMFGRVNLVYQSRDNVLTVPRGALIDEEGTSAAVYRVSMKPAPKPSTKAGEKSGEKAAESALTSEPALQETVERVQVQLGYIGDGVAEVVSGLQDGAQVVTLGQAALRDGTLVQVLNQELPPQSAPLTKQAPVVANEETAKQP